MNNVNLKKQQALLECGSGKEMMEFIRDNKDVDFNILKEHVMNKGSFSDCLRFILLKPNDDVTGLVARLHELGDNKFFSYIDSNVETLHNEWGLMLSPDDIDRGKYILNSAVKQFVLIHRKDSRLLLDFAKNNEYADFTSIENTLIDSYVYASNNFSTVMSFKYRKPLIQFAALEGANILNIQNHIVNTPYEHYSGGEHIALAQVEGSDLTVLQNNVIENGDAFDLVEFANVVTGADIQRLRLRLLSFDNPKLLGEMDNVILNKTIIKNSDLEFSKNKAGMVNVLRLINELVASSEIKNILPVFHDIKNVSFDSNELEKAFKHDTKIKELLQHNKDSHVSDFNNDVLSKSMILDGNSSTYELFNTMEMGHSKQMVENNCFNIDELKNAMKKDLDVINDPRIHLDGPLTVH